VGSVLALQYRVLQLSALMISGSASFSRLFSLSNLLVMSERPFHDVVVRCTFLRVRQR
jgi:hypothetical protein